MSNARFRLICLLGLLLAATDVRSQNLILNGGFESYDLRGWTTFVIPNGRLTAVSGPPDTRLYDLDGDGIYSVVSRFQAQRSSSAGVREGGGIFQNFWTSGGLATVHLDIYAAQPFNFTKPDPGIFSVFVDGLLIDEHDFLLERGQIQPLQLFSATLSGQLWLAEGTHELRILMRSSALNDGSAPLQYLDNISVTVVPEPTASALFGLGLLSLGLARSAALRGPQFEAAQRRVASAG